VWPAIQAARNPEGRRVAARASGITPIGHGPSALSAIGDTLTVPSILTSCRPWTISKRIAPITKLKLKP